VYDVRVDSESDTLYLTLDGKLSDDEMKAARDEVVEALGKLPEGFDMINDISTFSPPSPDAAQPIKDAQEEILDSGVGTVVRVVTDDTSTVVRRAFERRSEDVGYEGETAESVAEAERLLGLA
jgi:hypothetical protein